MSSRRWIAAVAAMMMAAGACTAKVEDEGKLPDVDVSGGEAPKVDVDPARVEMGTDTNTVVTPSVTVTPTDSANR
ncbi:MAG TPA: hypothetical protein VEX86_02110 [Longimicrobium sp.]|nr:hypothetical protein [Longimicrobium sp.]